MSAPVDIEFEIEVVEYAIQIISRMIQDSKTSIEQDKEILSDTTISPRLALAV